MLSETKLILDFTDYVAERTRDFIGREWVFRAINEWLGDTNGPRVFLLTGEPGSGCFRPSRLGLPTRTSRISFLLESLAVALPPSLIMSNRFP
jgi:hypothetical protein